MLKSISNIAWEQRDEQWVINKLRESGWDAIEIAPSRIWKDFRMIPRQQRIDYRKSIEEQGVHICSMHSLFWGVKEVQLFGNVLEQRNLVKYLKELVDLAVDLQSKVMVFGSPTVRDRKDYEYTEALSIASKVLYEPAEYAKDNGVKILIEPLTLKETNFIHTHCEAMELIEAVGSEGFGLHLDAKAVAEEEMEISEVISECEGKIEHFHINDPMLVEIGLMADYHIHMAEILKEISYPNYVSIEMRCTTDSIKSIGNSIDYVNNLY